MVQFSQRLESVRHQSSSPADLKLSSNPTWHSGYRVNFRAFLPSVLKESKAVPKLAGRRIEGGLTETIGYCENNDAREGQGLDPPVERVGLVIIKELHQRRTGWLQVES
jgi:hypothetical protein